MRIIENTEKFHINEPTAVAIGKFDGFHMGHRKLLSELCAQKKNGCRAAVFTFFPSPAAYFGGRAVKELSTLDEKRRIFEQAGADYLVEFPFYKEIADMEPEAFVSDVLLGRLNAKCVVAGDDLSFGRGGAGGCDLLERMAAQLGFSAIIIDKELYGGREISSTYVREAVNAGDMPLASRLLGAPYSASGRIVHGRRLGRELGMPTVNLLPPEEKLLPPNGVYYSYVCLNGKDKLPSVTNVGTKPTVNDGKQMGVETYIYDFDEDVYGEFAEVYLLERRRPEMRFDSVESLKAQMQQDIAAGKQYHGLC